MSDKSTERIAQAARIERERRFAAARAADQAAAAAARARAAERDGNAFRVA